jgi:hypothetical protein
MSHFRPHELEVLRLLVAPALGAEAVDAIARDSELVGLEHTGVGYFLTVRHASLPAKRMVCSEPMLTGRSGQVQSGFVVFLENGELTLECHSWGDDQIPECYRDESVEIAQPNKSLERTRER